MFLHVFPMKEPRDYRLTQTRWQGADRPLAHDPMVLQALGSNGEAIGDDLDARLQQRLRRLSAAQRWRCLVDFCRFKVWLTWKEMGYIGYTYIYIFIYLFIYIECRGYMGYVGYMG